MVNVQNIGRFLTIVSGCSSQESMGNVTLRQITIENGGFPPSSTLQALTKTNNFIYNDSSSYLSPTVSDDVHEELPFGGCVYARGVGLTLEHVRQTPHSPNRIRLFLSLVVVVIIGVFVQLSQVIFRGCKAVIGGAIYVAPYSFENLGNRFQVTIKNSNFINTQSAMAGGAIWVRISYWTLI